MVLNESFYDWSSGMPGIKLNVFKRKMLVTRHAEIKAESGAAYSLVDMQPICFLSGQPATASLHIT